MPATAGRVRMPANNRVHSSAALQTHGIWQSAIGYDPYAPTNKDDNKKSAKSLSAAEPEGENAYASFQGLLQLAKITNSNSDEARGACKKCGRVGHLTFQCRNFLSVKDDLNKDAKDDDVIREVVLEKLKGEKVKLNGTKKDKVESGESSEEEEEEDDSDSSDSDYDSEIERIIAQKYGKNSNVKGKLSAIKKEDEEEEKEGEKRKKRGRSKKRRSRKWESSDSEDDDEGGRGKRRKKRKEKRSRRDDDSSDDGEERRRKRKTRQEKRRRRSHRHSSGDSEDSSEDSPERRHKRRNRRVSSPSDSDVSVSDDDSRIGRDKKRDSRKRHREREN